VFGHFYFRIWHHWAGEASIINFIGVKIVDIRSKLKWNLSVFVKLSNRQHLKKMDRQGLVKSSKVRSFSFFFSSFFFGLVGVVD